MANDSHLPHVGEVSVVAFPIEKMNFIAGARCIDHALLTKAIIGALPAEYISV